MNMKELESLVLEQSKSLTALQQGVSDVTNELGRRIREGAEAHMHLVQRADNIVEGFRGELAARDERIMQLSMALDAARQELPGIQQAVKKLSDWVGADDQDDPFYPEFKALTARLAKLETLVLARNASAATKRNMTDEDALRVLTGDLRDIPHKEAAEKIGLTYAQVYSCRLEFTFKHVHKDLRDNVKEWKNPWSK